MAVLDHRSLLDYHFALINPLQVDKSTWEDLPFERIVPDAFASQPHLMPVLIRLDELDLETRVGLIERAKEWEAEEPYPWISALLSTTKPALRVQKHLCRMLGYRQSDGTHDLFRFYDPRVFQHFEWLLLSKQIDTLLGPIDRWSWRDSFCQWHTYQREEKPVYSFRLSQTQQNDLASLGELNIFLARLRRKKPEIAKQVDAYQVLQFLKQGKQVYKMSERADRYLFAEQALFIHPAIHRHPEMRRYLDAPQGGKSYVSACKNLNEKILKSWANQLNKTDQRELS